ncbi:LANO_0D09714g1_1 [Lachancea nothofagi CBS 11611]|uniref:LANO_0D09714g1_1 n=1 Tax=Lachancea nothofagi CBS 11611 TaxID=1266666 RepID=A0A1G4JJQ7_9SACH|nr:LANO_0D09714g1_1 [Lachancea nothofagi CBS 11611]
MAKRIADTQMTREALDAAGSDGDERDVVDSQAGLHRATSDVMRKRKIAQPRKRKQQLAFGNGNGVGSQESSMANAFSFGNATGTAAASTATTNSASAGAFSGFKSASSKSASTPSSDNNEIAAKRNALNLQFQTKIAEFVSKDPCADLSSVFDQYKRYFLDISGTATSPTTSVPLPTPISKPAPNSQPETSDSEPEAEVKVEGPTFSLAQKPTTNDSVFSFGAKKNQKPDPSDSESDIEIKGPSFTFQSTSSTAPTKSVFQFKSEPKSKETSDVPKPAPATNPASVTANTASQESSTAETVPKFSFGSSASSASTSTKPVFGSNAAAQTVPKPTFAFGQPSNDISTPMSVESKKPAAFSFGFNAAKTSDNNSQSKPTFSFGQSASTNTANGTAKPSFTFGTPVTSKPNDTEDASASDDPSKSKGEESSKPKPVTFGSSFSTGKKDESNPTSSFSFGQKPDTGLEDGEKPKPSFTFGAPGTAAAPSFSFGKPAESKEPPSGGFKFNLPFSSNAPSNDSQKANEAPQAEKDTETEAHSATEESNGITMSNGEEGEELLFSKRAKLMVINSETKGYESRGVGELKVLQSKDDKTKVRILCRSDGMGHVLLNTGLVKSFQYVPADADKENFVKCPVVNSEGKLENYIIRVKQKADGRQLCKSIKEAQDNM